MMSEAGNAVSNPPEAARPNPANRITELRVSGHLMTLEDGTFCVFQPAGSAGMDVASGLPSVRVSLPPGSASRPEAVTISALEEDGWLHGVGSAVLVQIDGGPAQVLVTIYQAQNAKADAAPRLQVLRLSPEPAAPPAPPVGAPAPAQSGVVLPEDHSMMAHIQRSGDVSGRLGEWMGTPGSGNWIEGFAIAAPPGIAAEEVEYQALLGRDWLSPWVTAGKFCGSRGMALPLLGIGVRLKGKTAAEYTCSYSAHFVDGTASGPMQDGEVVAAESLAAIEAFQVTLRPRAGIARRAPAAAPARPVVAAKPAAGKPSAGKPAAAKVKPARAPARTAAVPAPAQPGKKSAGATKPSKPPAKPARRGR
ncbi:MAG: hypothetical protein KGL12_04085 [Rhodospirillales bacterium]|nr:hypothetical protein [Rhodospirillales bacterium]